MTQIPVIIEFNGDVDFSFLLQAGVHLTGGSMFGNITHAVLEDSLLPTLTRDPRIRKISYAAPTSLP
jgi:hypothetical protein